ncbi:hypothetical protein D3C86_1655570 [compost metagenome]
MVAGQPDVRRGARGDDKPLARQIVEFFGLASFRHQYLYRDLEVGIGEVHHLAPLRGHRHVGEDEIHLVALQEGDAAGGLHRHELDLVLVPQQILGEAAAEIRVKAHVVALLVHIAEGGLVGEDADDELVAGLDLGKGSLFCLGGAAGEAQAYQCTEQNRSDNFHADSFRLMTVV